MRILIHRSGGLGDTLLLWPDLCRVRSHHPTAEIHLAGEPRILELFTHLPGVYLAARWPEPAGYDLAIWYGVRPNPGWTWVNPRWAPTVGPFPRLVLPGYRLADGRVRTLQAGLDPDRFALLAPGGNGDKRTDPRRFADIIGRLQARGISAGLLSGMQDHKEVKAVLSLCPCKPPVVRLSCPEVAGVIAHARLFVGNDSGPAHLAGLMGVPTVVLWCGALHAPEDWSPAGAVVCKL